MALQYINKYIHWRVIQLYCSIYCLPKKIEIEKDRGKCINFPQLPGNHKKFL